MNRLPKPLSFDWDKGNSLKNWEKHKVSQRECEEVFFNKNLKIFPDKKHSIKEQRYLALGKTNLNRSLTIIFTVRGTGIRIISARAQSKRERRYVKK